MSQQPTLVFAPGLLCDEALFAAQIQALQPKTRILVADFRQGQDSIDAMAQTVLELCKGAFSLVGLSMGGYVAMRCLALAPQRIERLVLMDTTHKPDSPERKKRRKALIELSQRGRFKGVSEQLLPQLIASEHSKNPQITQTIFDMAQRTGRESFQNQQNAILNREDASAWLSRYQAPSLVICGEADQLTPPDQASALAALLPHSRLELIANSGHLPPLEQPQICTKLLDDFLF